MEASTSQAEDSATAENAQNAGSVLPFVNPVYWSFLEGTSGPESDWIQTIRNELNTEGCAVLRDFLTPEALAKAEHETAAIRDEANFKVVHTNPYSTKANPELPEDHPVNHFMERTQGFVAKDRIPSEAVISRLYHSAGFRRFIGWCLGEDEIYEYEDPFASLVVNVLQTGATHPWHYDTNEFIVSMMTKESEGGGVFEYCPNIREPGNENYDTVKKVLTGEDRSPVKQLNLRPGDVQIFKGRFALHRVSPVEGERDRLTAIFAYAKEPGMVGKSERARALFNRVSEKHIEADKKRRSDNLVD